MTDDDEIRSSPVSDAAMGAPDQRQSDKLIDISFDETSIRRGNPNVEQERDVAIYDILDANVFKLVGRDQGPYKLQLALIDDRLALRIFNEDDTELVAHILALSPFRKIIRDYFVVCDSYYEAIRTAPPSRIQAIDMGRRGLHDEGSRILEQRLSGKIEVDHDTARRLFTLICALRWKD